jgi:hypothetical protein
MNPYTSISGLEEVVLEDSYVLDVTVKPRLVIFDLDVVLTDLHPRYTAHDGAFACFLLGRLQFFNARNVTWLEQDIEPSTDRSGQKDYGNIDFFTWEGTTFILEGSWGKMNVVASKVALELSGRS